MRGSPLSTERPGPSHIQKSITTATQSTHSIKLHPRTLELILPDLSTAPTSTKDLHSPMVKHVQFPTHKFTTTATQIMPCIKRREMTSF